MPKKPNPLLAAFEAQKEAEFRGRLQRNSEIDIIALLIAAHNELKVGPGRAGDLLAEFLDVKMGDLKEYLKQFNRKGLTLTTSSTASVTDFNAFEQDMTLVRAIMRADWEVKDDQAIVRGELTVAAG